MAAPLEHNRDGGYKASAEQMAIQQAAAAVAAEAYSPEAIAAESARREKALADEAAIWRREGREQCIREHREIEAQYLDPTEVSPPLAGGVDEYVGPTGPTGLDEGGTVPSPRKSRLAEALANVLDDPDEIEDEPTPEPEDIMGGAHLVRWILVPAEEGDGWTLGLSTESHEDEAPDQVYLEVTQQRMKEWRSLQGASGLNRFAAGLMEKVADALASDLTDALIEALERITRGELQEKQHLALVSAQQADMSEGYEMERAALGKDYDEPTRTSVGEDEPQPAGEDEPFDADDTVEPFDSLEDYVVARDHYATVLSRDEYVDFLVANRDYEDQIERQNA